MIFAVDTVQAITSIPATPGTVISAYLAGIAGIITAIFVGIKSLKNEGKARDVQLSNIELLVDGRYGKVLQELADMKRLLAEVTGKKIDIAKAEEAQANADEQSARVASFKEQKK